MKNDSNVLLVSPKRTKRHWRNLSRALSVQKGRFLCSNRNFAEKRTALWIKVLTIFYFVLFINYCSENTTKPDPPQPVLKDSITISLEQVTHRSVSLRLMKNDQYVVNRIADGDTFSFFIFPLSSVDTLVIDDNAGLGLTLNTEYKYFAYRLDSTGTPKDTSNYLTARTLPATSHDFSWTEYNIGGFGSALYDVWGNSPDNVYAVGGVSFGDSTFGVIKWDGTEWKPELYIGGKQAIYGFSESDIWIAGGSVKHYDGTNWNNIDHRVDGSDIVVLNQVLYDNLPYRAIWGTSSENLYFAGREGKIVRWDGEKASIEDIETDYLINAIWGFSKKDIWLVSGTVSGGNFGQVYHYNGKDWRLVVTSQSGSKPRGALYSLWGADQTLLYTAGNLLFEYNAILNNWQEYNPNFFTEEIHGFKSNNVFAVGDFGGIAHFNGIDWFTFENIPVRGKAMAFLGVWSFENSVFCVGTDGYIYIGKR